MALSLSFLNANKKSNLLRLRSWPHQPRLWRASCPREFFFKNFSMRDPVTSNKAIIARISLVTRPVVVAGCGIGSWAGGSAAAEVAFILRSPMASRAGYRLMSRRVPTKNGWSYPVEISQLEDSLSEATAPDQRDW